MSGSSWKFVMGILVDPEGNPRSGNDVNFSSGFSGMLSNGTMYSGKAFPDSKYYDIYQLILI